jgi:hypothetical protein
MMLSKIAENNKKKLCPIRVVCYDINMIGSHTAGFVKGNRNVIMESFIARHIYNPETQLRTFKNSKG